MVYRGRPSKGCGECRRKKIRCDQVRPACSQCLKSKDGRLCPGYRDEQALRFCDESSEVARKALAKQAIKLPKRHYQSQTSRRSSESSSSTSSKSHEPSSAAYSYGSAPGMYSISVSGALGRPLLESQGIRYFLANFVVSDADRCAGHMQNMLSWETAKSKTLQAAMGAVGLAGLSNQRSDASLMAQARQQYATALSMTKAHLKDPSCCKEDRTISAVALLGLFEVIAHSTPGAIKSWTNHVDGTIVLLNLRGVDLLKSEAGYDIFTQARSQILISCYQREIRVPPIVLDLAHRFSQTGTSFCRIVNDLLDSFSQFCELRAAIKERSLGTPPTIITSLLNLDATVVEWCADRTGHWLYTTVFDSSQPDVIYEGSYSVYRTHYIALVWNILRGTRIFIHEAIIAQIDELLTQAGASTLVLHLHSQRARSLAIISEMASAICDSAPYLLGLDRPYHKQLSHPAPAACGFSLMTGLYLVGNTIGVTHTMRIYALGKLQHIGHVMGIRQAFLLVDILQRKIEIGEEEEMDGLPRQFQLEAFPDQDWEMEDEGKGELGVESEMEVVPDCELVGRLAGYVGSWGVERAELETEIIEDDV